MTPLCQAIEDLKSVIDPAYVEICGGDKSAAQVLERIERWSTTGGGIQRIGVDPNGWVGPLTFADIRTGIAGCLSEKSIGQAVKRLGELSFVEKRRDCHSRKYFYRLRSDAVAIALTGGECQTLLNVEVVPRPRTVPLPKSGCVYLFLATGTPRYKIGKSTQLDVRGKTLRHQSPYPLELIAQIQSDDIADMENYLKARYAAFRVHGEWFELPRKAVQEICAMEREANGN